MVYAFSANSKQHQATINGLKLPCASCNWSGIKPFSMAGQSVSDLFLILKWSKHVKTQPQQPRQNNGQNGLENLIRCR
jgi:hypothetical protein